MRYISFLSKVVTIYFGEEKRFDCKNNHKCKKSANFYLDNISKINCKILVFLLILYQGYSQEKSNWSGESSNKLLYYYVTSSELLLMLISSSLKES